MNIFEDLLENTKGFPLEQRRDIQSTAETLQAVGSLATVDVVAETRYVLEHLPALREERVQHLRLEAKDPRAGLTKAERERDLLMADRLEKSTAKLKMPDADEQYKRRAALVELSVRLKAQLRDVAHTTPEMDPEHLKRFKTALSATTKSMPDEMGSKADREMMARMAFVQELRDAGGDVDLAVDNFYARAFEDAERGHFGDIGLEKKEVGDDGSVTLVSVLDGLQTPDYVAKQILREDQAEHDATALQNDVLQAMPKLAAEHLSPGQYAAYRVLIDNEHLIDWKIEDGKTRFVANTLDADDPENTIGKILQRDLHYQNIRGANMLIENTVDKLNGLLRESAGQDVVQTEKGINRMGKSTQEIVSDPAAQARNPYAKGRGGVEI